MKRSHLALLIIFLVLCIDQCLKIWIKTNFQYSNEVGMFGADWARIHFIENDGMAFGMKIGGDYGKLFLTLFRIVAVVFIAWYLISLVKHKAAKSLIVSLALIFAGAVGNILDSIFYGLLFDKGIDPINGIYGYIGTAKFSTEGYASLFHGNVVDMFYFPIAKGVYPEWMPIVAGDNYEFFRPVFNIADSAISIGVISILLFNREIFRDKKGRHKNEEIIKAPEIQTQTEQSL